MKKIIVKIGIGLMILAQSCTIFSLHPLYEEEDLLKEPGLLGFWQDTQGGNEYISFSNLGDKQYIFRYMEEQEKKSGGLIRIDTVSFESGLLKLGDHYFLDLYPYYEDGSWSEEDYLFRNFIPTHTFLKMEWENDRLKLYIFNNERLKELFEQNRVRLKHEIMGDYIVITASTKDLKRFIQKYADDMEAFDDPTEFKKLN